VPVPVPVPVPDLGGAGVGSRAGEASEHGDDAHEHLASRREGRGRHGLATVEDVEDGRGLGRRPARDPIEALLLVFAELAGSLGGVEDDGRRRSVELILEMCATGRHELMDLVHEIEQVEGAVVDVELGMVESHAGGIAEVSAKLRRTIDNDRAL
jgi:hypothetical protein